MLTTNSSVTTEEPLSIEMPVVTTTGGKTRITSKIRMDGKDQELWFEVDAAYGACLTTDTLDGFVVAMTLPAILRGRNLQPKGPMSAKLYYNLSHQLIPLLCDYLEKPRVVKLLSAELTRNDKRASGVVSGFSGGVDSFFNYYNQSGDRAPAEFHLTHFVFNNVGSHGQHSTDAARAIFTSRYAILQRFMHAEGKPFIAVDSNLDELMGLHFEQTYTIRNAAVYLLLQGMIGKAIYASSNTFDDTKIKPGMDMSKLDAVIIPLFATERFESTLDGAQMTRVEKTLHVAELPASHQFLDVCITPENIPAGALNCSACGKCLRTQLTLDAGGKLADFGQVFALDRYKMLRNIYLLEILSSRAALAREVRDYIYSRNYPVPRAVRLAALFVPYFVSWFISGQITPRLIHRPKLAQFISKCLSW